MKILQLGKFYPIRGGVERVMYDLLQGMSERNIHIDMLCASLDRSTHIVHINDNAIIYIAFTWKKLFATMISPAMILKLWRMRKAYDIIHVHHPDPMAALALWCSNYKGKVVLHWHSDILKQKCALKFYQPLQSWLIKRADVIIGTSPIYLQESPFLQFPFLEKKCIPIGIDPINQNSEKANVVRSEYIGKRIVFSLGRLVEYKGFGYLIEAAKYLSDEYVLLIGGDGPLRQSLIEQITANNLENKVKLLGRISDDDLPAYYGACDLYVLSSIWKTEAFGIVQIEAMSCGKPVVATKIKGSGVSWVNENGISGINVEPEDAKGMADAIIYILSDKDRYSQFSQAARIRYEKLFRKELMVDSCLDLYNSLVSKK